MHGSALSFRKLLVVILFVTFLVALILAARVYADSSDNIEGWAWSSTIGWIGFNCTNFATCSADIGGGIDYGVDVAADGNISGHAWSENVGWIGFDESCPSSASILEPDNSNCSATFDKDTGIVSGWARVCSGTINGDCTGADRSDGWDGWVSLQGTDYGVTVGDCTWSGYAWGSDVVGWISFSGAGYSVFGIENNSCKEGQATQCSDGVDNDDPEDTLNDMQDPGCYDTGAYSLSDDDETDTLPLCSNFFDDDGDGKIDLADPGCLISFDNDETDPIIQTENQCGDGIDNDGDGLVDAADPGCWDQDNLYDPLLNNESAATTQCQDGIDNDGDGNVDADDPGCLSAIDNDESNQCSDDIDNDNDGLIDGEDPGCWTDPTDSSTYDPDRSRERRVRIREVIPE